MHFDFFKDFFVKFDNYEHWIRFTMFKVNALVEVKYLKYLLFRNMCCSPRYCKLLSNASNLHNDCKNILNVKRFTSNAAIYCELGRVSLQCVRKRRILRYWMKLLPSNILYFEIKLY